MLLHLRWPPILTSQVADFNLSRRLDAGSLVSAGRSTNVLWQVRWREVWKASGGACGTGSCSAAVFMQHEAQAGQGHACHVRPSAEPAATPPSWQPPEVLDLRQATRASDVYSFGIILYELLTWRTPFHNLHEFRVGRDGGGGHGR